MKPRSSGAKAAAPRLGAKITRLRRGQRLSQAKLAHMLGISPSYLNLIEHNRRNVTVPLLLKLAALFEVELAELADDDDGHLASDLVEIFADDLFSDHDLRTTDIRDLVTSNPAVGKAVLALYDAYRWARQDVRSLAEGAAGGAAGRENRLPAEEVSDFVQACNNYFPTLEAAAERVHHDLDMDGGDAFRGMSTFLNNAFGVRVALTPARPGATTVRRFDPTAQTLEIAALLPSTSRNFQLAHQIGLLAADRDIEAIISGSTLAGDARILARVALANYFAAALLMPYDAFLEQAKAVRYDVDILGHAFAASFEQVCHRLTTLQRPGAAGVPFHMLRTDIAGNISKRFSLSGIHITRHGPACPRWNVYTAFLQPGTIHTQLSRVPDGTTFFCIARTIRKTGGGYNAPESVLSIGLGCEVGYADQLIYADGMDLHAADRAVPIGISCRTCERMDCQQRASQPVAHRVGLDENVRGLSAYVSAT